MCLAYLVRGVPQPGADTENLWRKGSCGGGKARSGRRRAVAQPRGMDGGQGPEGGGTYQKGDERILRKGEFVAQVLAQAQERLERKYRLAANGYEMGSGQAKCLILQGVLLNQASKIRL